MVYHSEGGWADSPPKWGSTYAKLIYLLDEMSGNVIARNRQGNTLDIRSLVVPSHKLELYFPT
jgi:hypothetical protein